MNNLNYEIAQRRVKKLKEFYSHATAFVLVNCFLVYINFINLNVGESYFQFKNFITFTFWGLGLLAHGLTVFLPNLLLSNEWEERKIKELMSKNDGC